MIRFIIFALSLFALVSCQTGEPRPVTTPHKETPKTADREKPGECIDGQAQPSPDGCNECICFDGLWNCTQNPCGNSQSGSMFDEAPPPPDTPAANPQCKDDEKKVHEDGCNRCFCRNGRWMCTKMRCIKPKPMPQRPKPPMAPVPPQPVQPAPPK